MFFIFYYIIFIHFNISENIQMFQWIERTVDEENSSITERQLKEKLYLDAIEYFDKGKVNNRSPYFDSFHT